MKSLLGHGGEMLLIHGYREFITKPETIETLVQLSRNYSSFRYHVCVQEQQMFH